MTLRKTIAGYFDDKKNWIDQVTIEMHPLEEATFIAEQTIYIEKAKLPKMPSSDELIELMLKEGQEVARQYVANIELAHKNLETSLIPEKAELIAKREAWNAHCEKCKTLKVDHNTYEKEKYNGQV